MNRIRELRNSRKMKQSDLASLLNCSPTTISNYESEYRGLDVDTIDRLCDIFDCSADYLLGRSPLKAMNLTPEEELLILAHRRADARAKEMVRLALEPFSQDSAQDKKAI